MKNCQKLLSLILLSLMLLFIPNRLLAAEPIFSYVSGNTGFLVINQQTVIQLNGDYKGLSVARRIKIVEERVQKLFATAKLNETSLQVAERNGNIGLQCEAEWLVSVDPHSAYLQRLPQSQLAEIWRQNLLKSLETISPNYTVIETFMGTASWYGREFRGRKTANGERFDETKFTAAHRSLSFGTRLRVTNLANNLSVIVKVNDRGPWVKNRVVDLSWAAARAIGIHGIGRIKVEVLADKGD